MNNSDPNRTVPPPFATYVNGVTDTGRRGDPLAVRIYRFLESRPRADLLEVFRALPASRHASSPERADLALRGLHACFADLGQEFSRRGYDLWRERQERPDEWPSSSFIRKTFHTSWHRALDAAGIRPAPDVAARALLRNGRKLSEEAKALALRMFAETVPAGKRTREAYRSFARKALQDPACPEIPGSAQAWEQDGRRFIDGMVDAGLPDERELRFVPNLRRGPKDQYTDEALLQALRDASQALGMRVLSSARYQEWVAKNERPDRWLPRAQSISRRFGTWARALLEAGLITEAEARVARHNDGRGMTTELCVRFLAAAMGDFGRPPWRIEYRRWRLALMAHPGRRHPRVPSDALIYERFGNDWDAACAAAQDGEPEPGLPLLATRKMEATR